MLEPLSGFGLALLFALSVAIGAFVRRRAPAEHRSKDSIELVQMVMTLLVTFAAIVLGLLTTSVKGDYDQAQRDRVQYAARLTQLDRCLRNYGGEADAIREHLRAYTAAVIASTWVGEPKPTGLDYPDTDTMPRTGPVPVLADLMNRIGLDIRMLAPGDPLHQKIAEDCAEVYRETQGSRWSVIEDVYSTMSLPFFGTVVFWTMIVYAGFGFRAPLNASVLIMIGLSIAAVASALWIVLDMNLPYTGIFRISSTAMRYALARMMAP